MLALADLAYVHVSMLHYWGGQSLLMGTASQLKSQCCHGGGFFICPCNTISFALLLPNSLSSLEKLVYDSRS